MTFHHKFSIAEMENLAPFELTLMVELTSDYIKRQEAEQSKGSIYG
jgi:hypothetical protein